MSNVVQMTPRKPKAESLYTRLAFIIAEAEHLDAMQMQALAEKCLDAFTVLADAADAKLSPAPAGLLALIGRPPGGAA